MAIIGFGAGHSDANANRGPTGYREGKMMRKFLLLIQREFENAGIDVTCVRTGSKDIKFPQRAYIADKAGVKMYISLHTDSSKSVKVLYSVKNPEQRKLALALANEIADTMGIEVGYVKARRSTINPNNDYYGIIRNMKARGIEFVFIVEHGGHGNRKEEALLKDPATFKKLAKMYVDFYKRVLLPEIVKKEASMIYEVGSRGKIVRKIQSDLQFVGDRLRKLEFNPGWIDGIFGEDTEKAVIAFQKFARIGVDGRVGPVTIEALVKAVKRENDKLLNEGRTTPVEERTDKELLISAQETIKALESEVGTLESEVTKFELMFITADGAKQIAINDLRECKESLRKYRVTNSSLRVRIDALKDETTKLLIAQDVITAMREAATAILEFKGGA